MENWLEEEPVDRPQVLREKLQGIALRTCGTKQTNKGYKRRMVLTNLEIAKNVIILQL